MTEAHLLTLVIKTSAGDILHLAVRPYAELEDASKVAKRKNTQLEQALGLELAVRDPEQPERLIPAGPTFASLLVELGIAQLAYGVRTMKVAKSELIVPS